MMIDMAEQEYNISVRKNSLPGLSTTIVKKKKWALAQPVNFSGMIDRFIIDLKNPLNKND